MGFKISEESLIANAVGRSGATGYIRKKIGEVVKPLSFAVIPNTDPEEAEVYFESENGELYSFDIPPLMDFSISKHIIETDINNGEGEVIEIVSKRAWNIIINGKLINTSTRRRPSEQIKEICSFFKENGVYRVTGQRFEEKEISYILFKNLSLPDREGFTDTVDFSITARSVVPPEISLIE